MIRFFFFFASRRRHTRFDCDWSSDVCSSDLHPAAFAAAMSAGPTCVDARFIFSTNASSARSLSVIGAVRKRSEERREGKSVDLGGRRIIKKKKQKDAKTQADDRVRRAIL